MMLPDTMPTTVVAYVALAGMCLASIDAYINRWFK